MGGVIRPKKFYIQDEYKFKPRILASIGKTNEYFYDKKSKKTYLVNIKTQEPVIQNYKLANTTRILQINAQRLHKSGDANHFEGLKIKKYLTDYFLNVLNQYKDEIIVYDFPLYIKFIYIVQEFKKARDIDNFKGYYEKVFLDCIQTKIFDGIKGRVFDNPVGFIENDSIEYMNKISHELLIRPELENKMIIKIYKNRK
jgi:hypothetical protein